MKKSYIPCYQMRYNIVLAGSFVAFCCNDGGRKPGPRIDYMRNGTETMENFFTKRELLHQELAGLRDIDLLRHCLGCRDLAENKDVAGGGVTSLGKINFLNYGYVPTLCQCKCIYCYFVENKACNNYKLAKQEKFAAKLSEIIDYLEKNKLLSDNFSIQVSSGEITVHPERDELLRIVMKYPCHWFTNAFVFNDVIAENLRNNKFSDMYVSLDCGTAETFKKIKGYDKFDRVIENLLKYNEHGNVLIKYILIPGINDSLADYNGIIALLKKFGHTQLYLARDTFINPLPYEVLESSALLYSMCKTNGINIDGAYYFSKTENDEIRRLVESGFGPKEIEIYENNHVRQYFRNKELTCANFTTEYRGYFFKRNFIEKSHNLREFLSKKSAVIWGASINGILLLELCCQNGIDVYLTDKNELKHGTVVSGKRIMPFSELADKVDTILLSNGAFYDSVKEQVGDKYDIIDFFQLISDLQ